MAYLRASGKHELSRDTYHYPLAPQVPVLCMIMPTKNEKMATRDGKDQAGPDDRRLQRFNSLSISQKGTECASILA